jgi:hypothetical protein
MAESLEERVARLEARIEELEDDRAIRELLARYAYNADGCRDEAYVQLYTEDGAMDLSGGQGNVRRWQGHEALREFITDTTGHQAPGFYGRAMHVQGNNVVTHIDGDDAIVNSYSIVLAGDPNGGPKISLFSAGNNQWTLKKQGGKWLIKERRRRHIGDDWYITNLDATPE